MGDDVLSRPTTSVQGARRNFSGLGAGAKAQSGANRRITVTAFLFLCLQLVILFALNGSFKIVAGIDLAPFIH
jgi:hypothetical protein